MKKLPHLPWQSLYGNEHLPELGHMGLDLCVYIMKCKPCLLDPKKSSTTELLH